MAEDADRPILISVGRLAIQKGFSDLIDAFSILHLSHPSAFLAIVGDGKLHDELQEKIKEIGLSDHVSGYWEGAQMCPPSSQQVICMCLLHVGRDYQSQF